MEAGVVGGAGAGRGGELAEGRGAEREGELGASALVGGGRCPEAEEAKTAWMEYFRLA